MTTIYHNPRCSKSRATLAILEQEGIDYSVVEYLKNPPTKNELTDILSKLGISARTLIRKRNPYTKLKASTTKHSLKKNWSQQWLPILFL